MFVQKCEFIVKKINDIYVQNIYVVRIKKSTLVSEVFLEDFLQEGERVSRKASRRERKPSGYLGLESHFHTD